jgi:cytochrome c2
VGFGQSGDEETGKRRQAILDAQLAEARTPHLALGREVFEANCKRCHVFGAVGTQVGPDLSTLSPRFKQKDEDRADGVL